MQNLAVNVSGSGPNLVMLHGWAMNSEVWQPVVGALGDVFTVHRLDLPGHGVNVQCWPGETLQDWLQLIDAAMPPAAICLGWSLGGLLALALAQRNPSKIKRLALVASSPKFVSEPTWQTAMQPGLLEGFAETLASNYAEAIEHFVMLQSMGSVSVKYQAKQLKALLLEGGQASPQALSAGLRFLQQLDMRASLKQLTCPALAMFGAKDKLVPVSLADVLRQQMPALETHIFENAAHAPFLSEPEAFANKLASWFEKTPL